MGRGQPFPSVLPFTKLYIGINYTSVSHETGLNKINIHNRGLIHLFQHTEITKNVHPFIPTFTKWAACLADTELNINIHLNPTFTIPFPLRNCRICFNDF